MYRISPFVDETFVNLAVGHSKATFCSLIKYLKIIGKCTQKLKNPLLFVSSVNGLISNYYRLLLCCAAVLPAVEI